MPSERLTKDQRREAAREAARLAREKQKRRESLFKWLVPTSVSLAIVAIAAVVVLVIVNTAPGPQSEAGPRNMISDGILFEGRDGAVVPVSTAAIPAEGEPTPTEHEDDGLAHVETYVDFSCPACQAFEATYAESIRALVAAGQATLEVHPVAILDRAYAGSRYSSRSNNVGACVAEYAPESFLEVMDALYAQQPQEQTRGHDDDALIEIVRGAGLEDERVETCIQDEYFAPFVRAATERTTSDPLLLNPATGGFSTPTIVVNGERWDGSGDVLEFIASKITAGTETGDETEAE